MAGPAPVHYRYRQADHLDVAAMAVLRAAEWGTEAYWLERIGAYLRHEYNPAQALWARAAFVAEAGEQVVGFAAGHLTRRFDCGGELQWLNVAAPCRRQGVGSALLRLAAHWFAAQNCGRICVDCDPENTVAHAFYAHHGAAPLNPHWLFWESARRMLRQSH